MKLRRGQMYQVEMGVQQARQELSEREESNRLRSEVEASAISRRNLPPEGQRYGGALERREQLRRERHRLEQQLKAMK